MAPVTCVLQAGKHEVGFNRAQCSAVLTLKGVLDHEPGDTVVVGVLVRRVEEGERRPAACLRVIGGL